MVIGEQITYLDLLLVSMASYLLVNSILIGIKERDNKASLFFSATGIFLSLCIFSEILQIKVLANQLASLLIWPSFFFYLVSHHRNYRLQWTVMLHVAIPLGWLVLYLFDLTLEFEGVFDFMYLLLVVGYGWGGIYKASKLRKAAFWQDNYLNILFVGLIIVISLRFILPVFIQSVESYTLYFHIILSVYFILLSSFYVKVPIKNLDEQLAAIQLDKAINYEEEMKRKLKNAMKRDKAFLDPELTLNNLADKLDVKSTALSNFINNNLGKNFNDFVNEYRIEEVKKLITSPATEPQVTIIEIAYDSGFNSKASFNRIFKQFTKMTPTQFKKTNQKINR